MRTSVSSAYEMLGRSICSLLTRSFISLATSMLFPEDTSLPARPREDWELRQRPSPGSRDLRCGPVPAGRRERHSGGKRTRCVSIVGLMPKKVDLGLPSRRQLLCATFCPSTHYLFDIRRPPATTSPPLRCDAGLLARFARLNCGYTRSSGIAPSRVPS